MRRALLLLTAIFALTPQAWAKDITVRGRLARTVETGGWLIVTDKEKYLLLNAGRFQSQPWFREDASVEAKGKTRPGVITTFMEGVPFEAHSVRPVEGGASGHAGVWAQVDTAVSVTGGVFTVSHPNVEEPRRHVARQTEHNGRNPFRDEFKQFLRANEIEYDERYL
jgi:hypothetical protein